MTNNDILEKYYSFLLELQEKFGVNDDCMQMIYLELLQYNNKKLIELDNNNEMKYWIVRLVKNYWFSKNSRYYYTYKRYYDYFEKYAKNDCEEEEY